MCLTIPVKIISVKGNKAKVDFNGREIEVDLALVKAKKGDWVLIQNKLAINRIDKTEAKEINKLFCSLKEEK